MLVLFIGIIMPLLNLGLVAFLIRHLEQANPLDAAVMRAEGLDLKLWAIAIARSTLQIGCALLLLFRHKVSTVWMVVAGLWLSGPMLILATPAMIEGTIELHALIRSALLAMGLSYYLLTSPRVKATYGNRIAG